MPDSKLEKQLNGGSGPGTQAVEDGALRVVPKDHVVLVDGTTKLVKEMEALDGAKAGADIPDDGRETWGKKVDFLLSIIGFAVDLANVWRFPYLCYRNGGGAFLIPYFLMLLLGAIPLFFMELILGQFHRNGAISVWKIAPIFKGIGMAECLVAYVVAFYYNVIIAWSLYYLVASFTSRLPWTYCGNDFNTPYCYDGTANTTVVNNQTIPLNASNAVTSATEFFERGVLGLQHSTGLSDLGPPRWQLVLCLLGVVVILYFSLWKGVKSSGKVVWVTATMPYVVLTILLIRGVILPGASNGILYFITPRIDRLGDPQVWIDAAIQIFYSVGAGFGTHLAYASYNKFNNNCYRDCLLTAAINSFTSIFSGIVIFSYLGYMAYSQDKDISQVAEQGPGLVFIVYPEAIATLPGSTFWSIIFFIMLITLGLDSAMGGLEALMTGLIDANHKFFHRYKYSREIFTGFVVGGVFVFSMGCLTEGGIYVFSLLDTFAAGSALLLCVFSQAVAISWFYGLEQISNDIYKMLGIRPSWYWRICWKFISPLFILVIIISSIALFKPLEYTSKTAGLYVYPSWANTLGWSISGVSMTLIPLGAIYALLSQPGDFKQKLALSLSPYWEHRAIQQGEPVKRFQLKHYLSI